MNVQEVLKNTPEREVTETSGDKLLAAATEHLKEKLNGKSGETHLYEYGDDGRPVIVTARLSNIGWHEDKKRMDLDKPKGRCKTPVKYHELSDGTKPIVKAFRGEPMMLGIAIAVCEMINDDNVVCAWNPSLQEYSKACGTQADVCVALGRTDAKDPKVDRQMKRFFKLAQEKGVIGRVDEARMNVKHESKKRTLQMGTVYSVNPAYATRGGSISLNAYEAWRLEIKSKALLSSGKTALLDTKLEDRYNKSKPVDVSDNELFVKANFPVERKVTQ